MQTCAESEAAGTLPLAASYPLDLPKEGTNKRKKFDMLVNNLKHRICSSK